MNETRGNLEVRGYVHVGNRDLMAEEVAGMKREGLVRILVSVFLWLMFLPCLCVMLAGLSVLMEGERNSEMSVGWQWVMRLAIFAVALEFMGALTQGRRGRNLRGDAKAGVANLYELQQVHPQQLPPYQWNQATVSHVEVLSQSERVWSVNGQPLKNGWDALRSNFILDKLGLRKIKPTNN